MKRIISFAILLGGFLALLSAFGFILQVPFIIALWPWPDGRFSYLFIGSILAAISAAMVWIGASGELAAMPAGALNILVIAILAGVYLLKNAVQGGRPELLAPGLFSILVAVLSGIAFFASRRLPLHSSITTPRLVRISFGIFLASLIAAGLALLFRLPIFPWVLNPDSSVLFGSIFLGDAFYFLYALLIPNWNNARGQLLSFLAYDLVLIGPFAGLLKTVSPEFKFSLIAYILVLVYSGGLAAYYLFLHPVTRDWGRYDLPADGVPNETVTPS